MRAIFVDGDGFEEIDVFEDFPRRSSHDWDCFDLGEDHVVWVLDDGLFRPGVVLATFGDRPNIPLPAYILGRDGERTVGATISVADLRGQASLQGRIADLPADNPLAAWMAGSPSAAAESR